NDPEALQKFMDAQGQLTSALSRLFAVAESYPQLRATDAFRDLQAQIEGTENRITVARGRYIETVQAYNTLVRQFPVVLTAKVIGAEPKATFEARSDVGDRPPEVKF
ncbi:MAG: LemA family protein, partial [Myxococcales bacterium]|nr:LemA family protein [Myxococcales bacterium]